MVTVQVLFGVRLAPVSATELPPAVAATTPPVQVVVVLSGVATIRPVGNTSLNWTPVSVVVLFGLPIMNVSVEVPFSGITFGVKVSPMVGGAITVRLALAVLPVPPLVELSAPDVLL